MPSIIEIFGLITIAALFWTSSTNGQQTFVRMREKWYSDQYSDFGGQRVPFRNKSVVVENVKIDINLQVTSPEEKPPEESAIARDGLIDNVLSLFYHVALVFADDLQSYQANVEYRFAVVAPTKRVILHLKPPSGPIGSNRQFELETSNGTKLDSGLHIVRILYHEPREAVMFMLNQALPIGRYVVKIDHKIRNRHIDDAETWPDGNSPLRLVKTEHGKLTYPMPGQFVAHRWFPCVDNPNMKAKFVLELETPTTVMAVGNTQLSRRSDVGPNRYKFVSDRSPFISPHSFGFLLLSQFRLASRADRKPEILLYFAGPETLEQRYNWIFDVVRRTMDRLQSVTNAAYAEPTFTVVITDVIPVGFSYYGLIVLGQDVANVDDQLTRMTLGGLVAGHWLGHVASVSLWSDDCLLQALGHYVSWLEFPPDEYTLMQIRRRSLNRLGRATVASAPSGVSLAKLQHNATMDNCIRVLPYVMRMTTTYTNTQVFQNMTKKLFEQYQFSNIPTGDYVELMRAVVPESQDKCFFSFSNLTGVPMLKADLYKPMVIINQNEYKNGSLLNKYNAVTYNVLLYNRNSNHSIFNREKVNLDIHGDQQYVVLDQYNVLMARKIYSQTTYEALRRCLTALIKKDDRYAEGVDCSPLTLSILKEVFNDFCFAMSADNFSSAYTNRETTKEDYFVFFNVTKLLFTNGEFRHLDLEYDQDCECCFSQLMKYSRANIPMPQGPFYQCNYKCKPLNFLAELKR